MDQPRDPPAPIVMIDKGKRVGGHGRHGPVSIVGARRRSYGYVCVAPPRIRNRGGRNVTRQGSSTAS